MRIRTMLATIVAISIAAVSISLNTVVANAQNCGVAPPAGVGFCLLEVSTMAGVVVDHFSSVDTNIVPVEPDNVDSWIITATHSTAAGLVVPSCSCKDYTSSVTATVSWTGSGWSVTCTGCNYPSGPIMSLDVCPVSGCSDIGGTHAWEYKLVARVKEQRVNMCAGFNAFLYSVHFETTAVDDGDIVDVASNCSEGSAVSPISQVWSATDYAFWCNLNCSTVIGPGIAIEYN